MKEIFDSVSIKCSRLTARTYSTSFSIGIRCLAPELRDPIYSIYGFVRLADEIVDSFHDYNKTELLERFQLETYAAIREGISMNPILNSFQATVRKYSIENELIDLFLRSMFMDLQRKEYDNDGFKRYVLGSAEAVGLMCLRVFCPNHQFNILKPHAMSLGSAFQKVNFLRDLKADFSVLGRAYFPGVRMNDFDEAQKLEIERSIESEFQAAYAGIRQLPRSSRLGVYVAYIYYRALFNKIKGIRSAKILQTRVRIRNRHKVRLLAYSFVKHKLNML